jgi:branched-chain amino acid aminotransferase
MCLPPPSRELFLRGVQHILQQNSHVIPPYGEGMKLYVRPMLLGSGQQLGLYPSQEFSLLFYVSPTVSEHYMVESYAARQSGFSVSKISSYSG